MNTNYKDENVEMYHEWLGAYDGWMAYRNKGEDFLRHRTNGQKIIYEYQPKEYGSVFFETEGGSLFRNLTDITHASV